MRIHLTEADAHDRECAENDAVPEYGLAWLINGLSMAYHGLSMAYLDLEVVDYFGPNFGHRCPGN